jgi:hypothetical protein
VSTPTTKMTARRGLAQRQVTAGCVLPRLAGIEHERQAAPAIWPCLLLLDAGTFTARCRWCGWASPGQPTLDGALAAFEGHACEESSP